MSDWPADRYHKPVISTFSIESIGGNDAGLSNGPFSNVMVASRAFFLPFALSAPYLVKKVWWHNGSAVAGNVDMGVYDAGGTGVAAGNGSKLFSSGSTAQAGVNLSQSVALGTPYLLTPGAYYFAIACDTATATMKCLWGATFHSIACGILTQAAAFPLPAQATFSNVINFQSPLCGISSQTVI